MKSFKQYTIAESNLLKQLSANTEVDALDKKGALKGYKDPDDGEFYIIDKNHSMIYNGKDDKFIKDTLQKLIDVIDVAPKPLDARFGNTGNPTGNGLVVKLGKKKKAKDVSYENGEYKIYPMMGFATGITTDPKEVIKIVKDNEESVKKAEAEWKRKYG